jgi:hypothetical protein
MIFVYKNTTGRSFETALHSGGFIGAQDSVHYNGTMIITNVIPPLPTGEFIRGVVIAGYATGPAFGIKGKYLVWDYAKKTAFCAGEFKSNFMTCTIGHDDIINEKAYTIITRILNCHRAPTRESKVTIGTFS